MASQQPGVWGIDLGLCALKAIRLVVEDGTVKATAFDYIEHPKILSQPDADPDQLTREALEQFLSRNSLAGDKVCISVAGQSGLARFVKLPPVEERKIADIVKFEAKQQIPFPLEEVVWDYQKIGTPMVSDGLALETEIGLFAMKKDMVNRALQQFKEVDIEVHIVQMAPLALINYLAYDSLGKDPKKPGEDGEGEEAGQECAVALDIGTDNSNLVITDGEKIIWQRAIPLGGNHFTRALTKDMKLTFAKAEHLKRNAVKSPDLRKILASLKSVLSDFVGEVQRSLGYFTNTHRAATVKYMVGLGGAFRLPGLQKFLQEKLQLEVKKISKFDRLKGDDVTSSPQFNENILSFAVPYGLALQGLKLAKLQTNLLPQEIRTERMVRGKKPWAAAAAAMLLVAVVGLAFGKSAEKAAVTGPAIDQAGKELTNVTSEISNRQNAFKEAETALEQSKANLRRIVAGSEERFNWQLLSQFINMALPQPDGKRLSPRCSDEFPAYEKYFANVPEARMAFEKLEARRRPSKNEKAKQDPAINMKDDEFIKKHLVQINIEGIHALYCDDFPLYFKNIHTRAPVLKVMREDEKKIVREAAEKPAAELSEELKKQFPEKAWIVEIRGYTYHQGGEKFIERTLVENLRRPEMVHPDIFKDLLAKKAGAKKSNATEAELKREMMLREQVLDQIKFLFLYKSEVVENPIPGDFVHIKGSHIPGLLGQMAAFGPGRGGPGGVPFKMVDGRPVPIVQAAPVPGQEPAPDAPAGPPKLPRDLWKPLADSVASLAHTTGDAVATGKGPANTPFPNPRLVQPKLLMDKDKDKLFNIDKQPRREFVVLFVWKEPLRTLEAPPEVKKE
jgi:type IV pilus assembly protein PilM